LINFAFLRLIIRLPQKLDLLVLLKIYFWGVFFLFSPFIFHAHTRLMRGGRWRRKSPARKESFSWLAKIWRRILWEISISHFVPAFSSCPQVHYTFAGFEMSKSNGKCSGRWVWGYFPWGWGCFYWQVD